MIAVPTWIWIVVIVAAVLLVLALVSSAGRRRVVADGDTVVTGGGGGAGAGFLLGVLFVIALLVVLAVGMWQYNWFGAHSLFQTTQAPVVTTPGSSPSLSSPSSAASPS